MKPIKTWIVLADTQSLRIAVNEGPGKGVYGLGVEGVIPPDITALSDEPGMTMAPAGPNRGGIAEPDLKGQATHVFARDIVAYLDAALAKGRYQRLILIAPAAMLGALRDALTPTLRTVLLGDIPKDLTHLPLDGLPKHIAHLLAV